MPEAIKQHESEGESASDSKAAGSPASPPNVPVPDMVQSEENQLAPMYNDTPLAVAEGVSVPLIRGKQVTGEC